MNDETTATIGSSATPGLRLPVQAAPVYRARTGAALAGGSSIEASGFFDDLVSGIRTGGQIASTLTPLISAI